MLEVNLAAMKERAIRTINAEYRPRVEYAMSDNSKKTRTRFERRQVTDLLFMTTKETGRE